MSTCEMKGYLSFLLLWLINKGCKTGAEITNELKKRKGTRPSPGTIYPALKELKDKKLVSIDKNKNYELTKSGKLELEKLIESFFDIFCDMDEMRSCCKSGKC